MLYSVLAEEEFSKRIPWRAVHLFWGDERCVQPDAPDSNYGMVREVLLRNITIPAGNVHRIRGEIPPEEAPAEYEAVLREFFRIGREKLPRFDLALLGLGEDGHTASLFPGSPVLDDESGRLAVASYVAKLDAHRVSLTLPGLNHAAVITFLVAGERKQSAVSRVVRHPDEDGELPAQQVRPAGGKLVWFLDEAVGAGIRPAAPNFNPALWPSWNSYERVQWKIAGGIAHQHLVLSRRRGPRIGAGVPYREGALV